MGEPFHSEEPMLADLLAALAGRESAVLLVGAEAAEALKAHGHDPAWTITTASLRHGSVFGVDGAALPGSQLADLVLALDTWTADDFPWLAMQGLARRLSPGGSLIVSDRNVIDQAGARRRLEAVLRWADLAPTSVMTSPAGVCVTATWAPRTGLRRYPSSVLRSGFWRLNASHGRRRRDPQGSLPAVETVEEVSPPRSVSADAFTGAPAAAVYEHRKDVLAQLTVAGVVTYGQGSYGIPEVLVYGGDDGVFAVGSWTSIADDVQVLVGGNHRTDRASTYPFRARYGLPGVHEDGYPTSKGGVTVGNDVWIGRSALLVSGARVGDGAIVAAGAVVAGTVRPYAIVAGNPAREVRRRFDDRTIERLLALRWWNWPESEILHIVPLLNDGDVSGLLAYGETRGTGD